MATDNFDFMIYEGMKLLFEASKAPVKFISGNTLDYILSINNTNILITHGHRLGKMGHGDLSKVITKSSDKGGEVSTGGVTTSGGTVIGSLPVFPSGLNPTGKGISAGFDVAAARRGEERGNVIINVNAPSAIDEEGFTRAVVLALNNSNARNGGGGAILGGLVAE